MGNTGVQEAMQGDIAKILDTAVTAPFKIAQILVDIKRDSADAGRNRIITKMQKEKLRQHKESLRTGKVGLKDLGRGGADISELPDIDRSALRVLDKNLRASGVRYHIDSYRSEDGNTRFAILFEDRNATKVSYAVDRSIRQLQDPAHMKKMRDRPSVMEGLKRAKERAAEINSNLPEKKKLQEQTR